MESYGFKIKGFGKFFNKGISNLDLTVLLKLGHLIWQLYHNGFKVIT